MWLLAGQLDANLEGNRLKKGLGNFWVKSIGIQATQTAPIVWQQTNLFERDALSHRDTIAKLIDGLSSRLGRKAVVAPSLHRNPQPELAFSWRPLTGWRKDGQIQETKRKLAKAPKRDFADELGLEPTSSEAWRRPTRLIQPPQKIDVVWDAISNQPSTVRYRGDVQCVRETSGPERVDSGWWQGITQQRDYYRVKLESGPWLWIYRDRRNATWMLHGEFD
jgi:protein ImuB